MLATMTLMLRKTSKKVLYILNSMEPTPGETNSCSVSQETPCLLQDPKVHYRILKIPRTHRKQNQLRNNKTEYK